MYPVAPVVAIMIGNEARPTVSVNGPVEIVENEECGEPETRSTRTGKGPRHTCNSNPGRRVISDDWRPLIVVVVIDSRQGLNSRRKLLGGSFPAYSSWALPVTERPASAVRS